MRSYCFGLGLFLCLFITACSTPNILPRPLSPANLEHATAPARELRLVILADSPEKKAAMTELVEKASRELRAQVDISLKVVEWKLVEWQSYDRVGTLNQVAQIMGKHNKPFDIAVAFQHFSTFDLLQYMLIGTWEGVIDDTYRRFIVIRRMSVQILLHEICHAFIFSHDHSWGFRHLMTPVTLYIVPGLMPLNRSSSLKERDREEIVRNRWRDFSVLPNLQGSRLADPLPLSTEHIAAVSESGP